MKDDFLSRTVFRLIHGCQCLDHQSREYSASPVYADGKIWLFSEDGKTTVLKPGRAFEKLAENKLDEGFLASPAIAGKAFYLRTRTHLYRIEQR